MKKCAVCGRRINDNGWGKHAYATDDGSAYIHHQCRPDPPIRAQASPTGPLISEFLTLPQAAQLLGVSTQTLRRRIKARTLAAFRLDGGQTILIERAALLALLKPM